MHWGNVISPINFYPEKYVNKTDTLYYEGEHKQGRALCKWLSQLAVVAVSKNSSPS
jgi:hypothetical protein